MIKLAYCDFIADRIRKALVNDQWTMPDGDNLVDDIGPIKMDLHPTEGYMQSTGKTLTVWDTNGKAYFISVQEAPMLDKD
jgi:hypothetical protein